MFAIYKKEIRYFFSSLIGPIVLVLFLLINSLFLWVIPISEYLNILQSGFASLEPLFSLAPWMYLILIPAMTMRAFTEEKSGGTMELLLTRPLTEGQIIWGKLLAYFTLLLLTLLPTVVYYLSVVWLGDPVGNIDKGATLGSYLGLFLLGAAFIGIGVHSSSITKSPIIALLLSIITSLIWYSGFGLIGDMLGNGELAVFWGEIGIEAHYYSISRGLIEIKDIAYYLGVIVFFFLNTKVVLAARKHRNLKEKFTSNLKGFASMLIILAVIILSYGQTKKYDLTEDNRFTLADSTVELLEDLDDVLAFKIYLEGASLPADLTRLKNSTQEILEEFVQYAPEHIEYEFIDLYEIEDKQALAKELERLGKMGIQTTPIQFRKENGEMGTINTVLGGEVYYEGRPLPLPLIRGRQGNHKETINSAIEALEYEFSNAIRKIQQKQLKTIGFLQDHWELDYVHLQDFAKSLAEYYYTGPAYLRDTSGQFDPHSLDYFDVVVIAKPQITFEQEELYLLDQFVMTGGRIMWMIDGAFAELDSLKTLPYFPALPQATDLDALLFNYGAKLNSDIVEDLKCLMLPITPTANGNDGQAQLSPWIFSPIVSGSGNHLITQNLDPIQLEFVSSLQPISVPGVKSTQLLATSGSNRFRPTPTRIGLEQAIKGAVPEMYTDTARSVALLLEGNFGSYFRNRIPPTFKGEKIPHENQSPNSKMIVISDGDIAKNMVDGRGQAVPLGTDRYSTQFYDNKKFLLNCINYLTEDSALIPVRSKTIKMRLLDPKKVKENKQSLQILNIGGPIVLILLLSLGFIFFRKIRFSK